MLETYNSPEKTYMQRQIKTALHLPLSAYRLPPSLTSLLV